MKKKLITSALPYVNNVPHLGNLTQVLSADVFARFCRSKGYETLYICGTDEYGTATETRAQKEGVSPKELCDHYHVIHEEIYKWFNINFDYFGRTSTPKQTEIVQSIFREVDANGYIFEKETEQLYCPNCKRFLADRYVEGTCPNCGAEGARGDQCDNCQTLLEPTELIAPHCMTCGTAPIVKKTRHLYLDLPKALPLLESWMNSASTKGFWAKNAVQVTKGWIRDGLKERCITRDLTWGIPVPKPGFEGKVFYVWFDAPIGYLSITANYTDDWKAWWQNPDNVELFQFIGKDNIPFHTVIFPSTLLCTDQKWTMLHHMSSTEYLNYEGGKFSKSKGVGIFGNDVQSTGLGPDFWRFYMFYNRPEKSDFNFIWKDFQEKVNTELMGNLSNLVNRTLTFIKRFYDGKIEIGELDLNLIEKIKAKEEEIDVKLERSAERDAFRKMFELSSIGNKAFQDGEPWKARNENPEQAEKLLRTLLILLRDLGILIEPYIPGTSKKLLSFLKCDNQCWKDLTLFKDPKDMSFKIDEFDYLFVKIPDDKVEELKERFSGTQEERLEKDKNSNTKENIKPKKEKKMKNNNVEIPENETISEQFARRVTLKVSKIVEVVKHPGGEYLYILTLNTGEEMPRNIVSSIVPYYKPEELLNQNIVLVSNLKPANFRGVKSRGMLLAASDKNDNDHSTCEVLFANQFEVGTVLVPEGLTTPDEKFYIKADPFFAMPLYTEAGVVKVDGLAICADGKKITATKYINGNVG